MGVWETKQEIGINWVLAAFPASLSLLQLSSAFPSSLLSALDTVAILHLVPSTWAQPCPQNPSAKSCSRAEQAGLG